MRNLWTEHSAELGEAFVRSAGPVQFELVTRALLKYLPADIPKRIVDVGGGFGQQAIMLARAGHFVTVLDFDPAMLAVAAQKIANEDKQVAGRINLVQGEGINAVNIVGGDFDMVCCHSVLMYLSDPLALLQSLVQLTRPGGFISILSLNTESIAMRSGLQGRWEETWQYLANGTPMDKQYLPVWEHSRDLVTEILNGEGAPAIAWHGVGVFTDHLTEKILVADPEDVFKAEWLAGNKDPYRQVARCFHLICQKQF